MSGGVLLAKGERLDSARRGDATGDESIEMAERASGESGSAGPVVDESSSSHSVCELATDFSASSASGGRDS